MSDTLINLPRILTYMTGVDDAAAGMMGVLASTAMIGVGVAGAGMVMKQMDKMGDVATQQPRRRKRKSRK